MLNTRRRLIRKIQCRMFLLVNLMKLSIFRLKVCGEIEIVSLKFPFSFTFLFKV